MTRFLCIKLVDMSPQLDTKEVLSSLARHRVTAQEIADILGTSRNTINKRMKDGFDASDIIKAARGLGINPVTALQELGYVTIEEVVYRLAEESLPAKLKVELASTVAAQVDDLAERRKRNTMSDPAGTMPEGAVADSSPDEDALREDGDWTDPDNIP